ncbi:hypothetical protein MFUL124B02_08285 [Myxococcus fulvus 124B02]|nr:hypothetical protein MFUL124B02_08285 [Myxococcus fulvus 124B02]
MQMQGALEEQRCSHRLSAARVVARRYSHRQAGAREAGGRRCLHRPVPERKAEEQRRSCPAVAAMTAEARGCLLRPVVERAARKGLHRPVAAMDSRVAAPVAQRRLGAQGWGRSPRGDLLAA